MKEFNKQQIDDIIRLRYGKLVSTPANQAFASYQTLGKIFGASSGKIRQLIFEKFK